MLSFSKKLLIVFFFLSLSAGLIDVVTSILIWEVSQSLQIVLTYMGALFIAIIPSSFLIGLLIDKIGGRLPFMISLISFGLVAGEFVFFPSFVIDNVWIFGALAGLANTAFYLTAKVISTQLISQEEQSSFNSAFSNFIVFSYLFAPLALLGAKQFLGRQESVLILAGVSAIIGFLLLIRLSELKNIVNKVDFDVFNPFDKVNSERKSLFLFSFVLGIKSGIFWAVFSVVTLMVLDSLAYWGIVTFLLKITSMVTNRLLSKMKSIEKFEQLLLGSGIFYLGTIVIVLANVSVSAFLVFAFVDAVVSSIILLFYSSLCYEITVLDKEYKNKITEYGIFEEVALTIGRIASLLLLGPVFIFATKDENLTVIIITFMVISFVPLLFFKIIQKSKYLSKNLHLSGVEDY